MRGKKFSRICDQCSKPLLSHGLRTHINVPAGIFLEFCGKTCKKVFQQDFKKNYLQWKKRTLCQPINP